MMPFVSRCMKQPSTLSFSAPVSKTKLISSYVAFASLIVALFSRSDNSTLTGNDLFIFKTRSSAISTPC